MKHNLALSENSKKSPRPTKSSLMKLSGENTTRRYDLRRASELTSLPPTASPVSARDVIQTTALLCLTRWTFSRTSLATILAQLFSSAIRSSVTIWELLQNGMIPSTILFSEILLCHHFVKPRASFKAVSELTKYSAFVFGPNENHVVIKLCLPTRVWGVNWPTMGSSNITGGLENPQFHSDAPGESILCKVSSFSI